VDQIDKQVERGKVVYDVDATVAVSPRVLDRGFDGEVLGTETSIKFGELPAPSKLRRRNTSAPPRALRRRVSSGRDSMSSKAQDGETVEVISTDGKLIRGEEIARSTGARFSSGRRAEEAAAVSSGD